MPSLKMARLSVLLFLVLIIGVLLSISSTNLSPLPSQVQTPDCTRPALLCEGKPLPTVPVVGPPQRDHLSPITVETVFQLAPLSAWDLPPEEGVSDWQLGPLFFDPHSGLLARSKTGHVFFQMGTWHLWNVSDPWMPVDLGPVSGTGYDYTFWTYADTVFTETGYARARASAEFPNAAQDWGGSAMPSTRWITYQRSGEPEIIVQQDYVGQQYSPKVWLKLSADGSHLIVYYPGMLYVWETNETRTLASISPGTTPYLVGFSPDNRYIVTIEDEAFVFRRIESGELVQVLTIPDAWGKAETLPEPQFMPENSSRFVKSADLKLEIWDLGSPEAPASTTVMPCVAVRQMAFSPDGMLLAVSADCSTTAGRHPSEVQLWQASTMNEMVAFPADITVTDLAFSPDGYLLAIGDSTHTELWGIPTQ